MVVIGTGELEVTIGFEEPGNREALVDAIMARFNESIYFLSDIDISDNGRYIDIYVESTDQEGYLAIAPFVGWLKGEVASILNTNDVQV